jgi:hypothetical protein
MGIFTRIFSVLLLTYFTIVPLASAARTEIQVGDVVLYPSTARSGRMFPVYSNVKRVGLVRELEGSVLTVQEINYPSRNGNKIVRFDAESGEYLPYDGTHQIDAFSSEIIKQVSSLTRADGDVFTRGTKVRLYRNNIAWSPGFILYVFQREGESYVVATNAAGWAAYRKYGELAYEREHIQLKVMGLSKVVLNL